VALLLSGLCGFHAPAWSIRHLFHSQPLVAGKILHPRFANSAARHSRGEVVDGSVSLAATGMARAARCHALQPDIGLQYRLLRVDFGRWLRLLTTHEYDLKAVGWARTVSGCQSLLSVYLIALWVLTYFGRPFA
jgi:hypothetical protein